MTVRGFTCLRQTQISQGKGQDNQCTHQKADTDKGERTKMFHRQRLRDKAAAPDGGDGQQENIGLYAAQEKTR